MTSSSGTTLGSRSNQGEGASYSLDGRTWVKLTANNTSGWEGYSNYGSDRHAWKQVVYGWSNWLSLNQPVKVRFIRFKWDGDKDELNEIELMPCANLPEIKSNFPGLPSGVSAQFAFDGNPKTFFKSSHNNWQHIQIGFDCEVDFLGLRRRMASSSGSTTGSRSNQGEGVSYSLDGRTWIKLTANNTNGWEGYSNYGADQHAWKRVAYGWSNWLSLEQPVKARYIRFKWDGDNDILNEIELMQCKKLPKVSSNFPAVTTKSAPLFAFDGDPSTNFRSSHNDWQHIQIEFDCEVDFLGLRRMMTSSSGSTTGSRSNQGEGVSYSLDGRTWVKLTANITSGWEGYSNYGSEQSAWKKVAYGWSNWLSLNQPVKARFIRFKWDGDNDVLNEIQIK